MFERKSLTWPILLAIFMIVGVVGLTVGWVLLNVFNAISAPTKNSSVYWVLLSVGSIIFVFILIGIILYLVWIIQNINLNRRQSNFIDAVTHELKTPIASLKLYLQTLHRRPVEGEQRIEFYRTMMEDVDRLDRLINQLLDVARLQQKQNDPAPPEWIDLDAVIRQFVTELTTQNSIPADSVRLQVATCEILAHRVDAEILIRNLMENAIKYAGKPPEIDIELKYSDGFATLSVSDNGTGVPRHLRRKIFQRFYRAGDELERRQSGTGLGLFLVRSIVQRLKGNVRVVDVPRKTGSCFVVSLPNARLRTS
ncbi:MAG: HAMP domain-containing histidine kinase [Planctomycetes bacterium]|nr:HAMP domain-containing histidine kinase [Planctomycetota bacterium]